MLAISLANGPFLLKLAGVGLCPFQSEVIRPKMKAPSVAIRKILAERLWHFVGQVYFSRLAVSMDFSYLARRRPYAR